MTRRQVAAYAKLAPSYKLDPLALARDGVQLVLDWLASQGGAPLIYATAGPQDVRAAQDQLGRDRPGAVVENVMAQIAEFARDKEVRRVCRGARAIATANGWRCIARSTRPARVQALSCTFYSVHSVALSLLEDQDPDNFLPPLTPYEIMKLGKVALLPFFLPGDAAMGEAVRGLAGKRSAVILAHHGPVVAGKDVEAACNAIEKLEDTARLALLTHGMARRQLSDAQIKGVVTKFDVEWEA
jgi:hypothetical protein